VEDLPEPWLDPHDFESQTLTPRLRNHTSGWTPPTGAAVRVERIEPAALALEVPARSCSQGHLLWLRLELRSPGEPAAARVECDARVVAVEALGGERDLVEVVLVQYPRAEWAALRARLERRQDEIRLFLEAAGGRA
jgi:hypothetical protein